MIKLSMVEFDLPANICGKLFQEYPKGRRLIPV